MNSPSYPSFGQLFDSPVRYGLKWCMFVYNFVKSIIKWWKYLLMSPFSLSTWPECTITTPDSETVLIEINATGQSNSICGIIYWHPESNNEHFMDYINSKI